VLCRDLDISRSAYYQWLAEAQARRERARAGELLVAEITLIWIGSRRTYGVPRIDAELRRRGRVVNRKKLEHLMREHQIVGCHRRRGRRSLTKQEKAARFAPDLIGRDFTAKGPGRRLVADRMVDG
jgi:putative transposase